MAKFRLDVLLLTTVIEFEAVVILFLFFSEIRGLQESVYLFILTFFVISLTLNTKSQAVRRSCRPRCRLINNFILTPICCYGFLAANIHIVNLVITKILSLLGWKTIKNMCWLTSIVLLYFLRVLIFPIFSSWSCSVLFVKSGCAYLRKFEGWVFFIFISVLLTHFGFIF